MVGIFRSERRGGRGSGDGLRLTKIGNLLLGDLADFEQHFERFPRGLKRGRIQAEK